MRPFKRHEAPEFLQEHWEKWGLAFQKRREKDGGATFQWPTFNGNRINNEIESKLALQTHGRCAYCDDYPLGTREDSIDHYRPKSIPDFYALVCKWENLYYACGNCQSFKGEHWSHETLLIAPDESGYSFSRFFIINRTDWTIEHNPHASVADQERAKYTIETLGLQDSKHKIGRKQNWQRYALMLAADQEIDISDFAYRYLFEIGSQ